MPNSGHLRSRRFEEVLTGSAEGWFTMSSGARDVGLGVAAAGRAGRDLRVARAVKALFDTGAAGDLSDADVAAVGRLYGA